MKRQINIELLRIVAMLMVLGLHANFVALHIPDADSILTFTGINRVFWQSACIVAVNVFVMISGWFGIKPSIKGFCNFMWQVVYIVGLLWIVGVIFFNQSVSMKSLLRIIGLYGGGGWFVASYIALYIISPILNAYVEKTAPRNIVLMLVAFFLFEFLWGNTLSVEFVVGGYSTFSFIGIYLLAGLLRKLDLKYSSKTYLGVFFIAAIINTVCIIVAVAAGSVAVRDTILNYINPLVIIGAASLLLAFAKSTILTPASMQSGVIQRVVLLLSASCFAAYLLHVGSGYALGLYCDGVKWLYDAYSGCVAFVMIVGYIFVVFY